MEEIPKNEIRMTLYKNCVECLGTVPPFWLVTGRYTPLPVGLQAAFLPFIFTTIGGFLARRGNANF
jgi:hypothetical protein